MQDTCPADGIGPAQHYKNLLCYFDALQKYAMLEQELTALKRELVERRQRTLFKPLCLQTAEQVRGWPRWAAALGRMFV